MKSIKTISVLILILLVSSCTKFQKITDIVVQPTARERYKREFKDSDSIFKIWENTAKLAKQNNLKIPMPFTLSGKFQANKPNALGYEINLERGELLNIDVKNAVDTSRVFMDIFYSENDSVWNEKPILTSEWQKTNLQFQPKNSGRYKVVIQSELQVETAYKLFLYTQPSLGFPVVGKQNSAIQSFWGATRSGGSRSHEGVDIFAARGTPLVAISDGYISSVGERGLGGKQVWLRNSTNGFSIYYAHLDSIAVQDGISVKIGDTLGFVGNTGNAKTTSPHLHLGIYTGNGAIDPLPFIKIKEIPSNISDFYKLNGETIKRQNELRTGPNTCYKKLATLESKKAIQILGKSKQWLHVKTENNEEGFMHESLIFVN